MSGSLRPVAELGYRKAGLASEPLQIGFGETSELGAPVDACAVEGFDSLRTEALVDFRSSASAGAFFSSPLGAPPALAEAPMLAAANMVTLTSLLTLAMAIALSAEPDIRSVLPLVLRSISDRWRQDIPLLSSAKDNAP